MSKGARKRKKFCYTVLHAGAVRSLKAYSTPGRSYTKRTRTPPPPPTRPIHSPRIYSTVLYYAPYNTPDPRNGPGPPPPPFHHVLHCNCTTPMQYTNQITNALTNGRGERYPVPNVEVEEDQSIIVHERRLVVPLLHSCRQILHGHQKARLHRCWVEL